MHFSAAKKGLPYLLIIIFIVAAGWRIPEFSWITNLTILLSCLFAYQNRAGLLGLFQNTPRPIQLFLISSALLPFYLILNAIAHGNWITLFGFEAGVFLPYLFTPLLYFYLRTFDWNIEYLFKVLALSSLYIFYLWYLAYDQNFPYRFSLHHKYHTSIAIGSVAMLFGLINLILFFYIKGPLWQTLALLSACAAIGFSFYTGSRGGWVVLPFALLTLAYTLVRQQRFVVLLAIALTLTVALIMAWDYLPLEQRINLAIHHFNNYYIDGRLNTSIGYRFSIWNACFSAWKEAPIIGIGFGNLPDYIFTFLQKTYSINWPNGQPHNDYLLILGELGSIGLLLLCLILVCPLYYFIYRLHQGIKRNHPKQIALSLVGLILVESVATFMLTDSAFSTKYISHLFLMLILVVAASRHNSSSKNH